jgi:glycosyltransferase involved in cell wall biosynthesis
MTVESPESIEPTENGEVEETIGAALDQDFYLRSHPELEAAGVDALRHYIDQGHDAGFWPTAEFDTGFYLSRSPDVAEAGMNAFFHYLKWGRVEGRAPNALALEDAARPSSAPERLVAPHVDPTFYFEQNPEIGRTHVDAAKHYLHFGWHAGLDPSPGFSTRFYRAPGYETDAHENPLHHFLRVGRSRGRLPKPLLGDGVSLLDGPAVEAALEPHFDREFYRAAYPEAVRDADPLPDYMERGWRDGRDPAPWFSTTHYLARFPDIAAIGANPFLHWVLWGREQGFPPIAGPGGAAPILGPTSGITAELRPMALPYRPPEPGPARLNTNRLEIHWIIPDVLGPGRGGHMTVFRLVRWLEILGHRCVVWVNDPHPDWSDEARRELIQASYQAIAAPVRVLGSDMRFPAEALVVATSWTTALVLNAAPSARQRFYLVQDDERAFHPAGAKALAAARTYDLDLGYLCAGRWLAETLTRKGRWARAFDLAPDQQRRRAAQATDAGRPAIAFYARGGTERRAVELGLLAFEALAAKGIDFEVHLFGSDTAPDQAAFPVVDHGVVDSASLEDLYARCTLGVCFSATNHSLIPQEMMACGLPVVELDGPSTRAVFPPDVITLSGPEPAKIADALARLLTDPKLREAQADRAAEWVSVRSWERSARAVEAAMLERLHDTGAELLAAPGQVAERPLASVLIPTLNGGEALEAVLDAVLAQRTPWPFEVVVVDSQSDDGTWERLQSRAGVRSLQISRSEFQHGRTRNLLASEARGEFLAYLTQDAEPAGPLWLADIVGALQSRPRAAGAFGRHLPRPEASAFTKRDLHGFFRHLAGQPLERSKFNDLERWRSDPSFRRELHFFSSNNSCLRRSVWSRIPLPETDYGEDQLWAARVLQARYSTVYAPTAAVVHSHEYDEASRFERARIEGRWLREHFRYADVTPDDPEAHVARMNAGDERWGMRNGVAREEIERKKRLNAAEIAGLLAATRAIDPRPE